MRHSAVETDTLVRRDSARGLALAIDQTFLDTTNSGSEVKPASITNCISPVETLSGLMADFTGDLTKAVWIGQPEVLMGLQSPVNPNVGINGGEFMGAPAFACRSAPNSSLALVDPTGLTFAMGELEYETSRYGTVQMVDVPRRCQTARPRARAMIRRNECRVALSGERRRDQIIAIHQLVRAPWQRWRGR